jgi:uncharacterized lipoprotein
MDRLGKTMLLGLLSLWLAGCPVLLGAGMTAGTYHVIQGDLTRLYRAGYDRAWDAAVLTLEQMEMKVVKETRGDAKGKIEAKRYDGTPIRLMIKQKALDVTELRVRIGSVGDRAKAELFHEQFRGNVFD